MKEKHTYSTPRVPLKAVYSVCSSALHLQQQCSRRRSRQDKSNQESAYSRSMFLEDVQLPSSYHHQQPSIWCSSVFNTSSFFNIGSCQHQFKHSTRRFKKTLQGMVSMVRSWHSKMSRATTTTNNHSNNISKSKSNC